MWYGYSFLGLELGSLFSPPLAEDLLAPAFSFPFFKEIHYFFRHCRHMARQRVCITRRFDFSTAFTVDLLNHLWDQDRDLVLDEKSNSQLFSSAYIFNSQNWISTRILRVCKHEFRALGPPVTYFGPALDGRIWPKNNNTCKGPWVLLPYQVSSKSIKRFWRSWNVKVYDDGRTDDGQCTMTIAHLSLRLRWAKKSKYSLQL